MVDESYLRQYLLRELSSDQQEEVEARITSDEQFKLQLLCCEDDLLDDYVRGKLCPAESMAFEAQYLTSPAGRGEVEFARRLADYARLEERIAQENQPRRSLLDHIRAFSWLPSLTVAAEGIAMTLLVCVAILWMQNHRLHNELQKASVENANLQHQPPSTAQQSARLPNPTRRSPDKVQSSRELKSNTNGAHLEIALVLTPNALRDTSSSMPTLSLTRNVSWVRLLLTIESKSDESGDYEADVFDPDTRKSVFHDSHLEVSENANGPFVVLQIPSRSMRQGEYIVTLSRSSSNQLKEDVASYSLHVIKK